MHPLESKLTSPSRPCAHPQIVYSDAPSDVPEGSMMSKYSYLIQNSLTMLVPAAIYLAMNILGFLSLKYIDAATFAIIAQVSRAPRAHARLDASRSRAFPPA